MSDAGRPREWDTHTVGTSRPLGTRHVTDAPLTPFDPDTTALRWRTTTTPTTDDAPRASSFTSGCSWGGWWWNDDGEGR